MYRYPNENINVERVMNSKTKMYKSLVKYKLLVTVLLLVTQSNASSATEDNIGDDILIHRNNQNIVEQDMDYHTGFHTTADNRVTVFDKVVIVTDALLEQNTSTKYNDTKPEDCVGDEQFCNMTEEDYTAMLNAYIYPQTYEWVLIATHSAVFVMGLVGNALVCVAVYRNHSMRTVTNLFIVNLAVADFLVLLLCLPPTVLWDVTETWFLGEALCKVLLYFQSVSVMVSVLTLTCISGERWYAVCHPLRCQATTSRAKHAVLLIWTLSLLFNSPELVVLTTVRAVPLRFELQHLVQCMPTWSARSDLLWHLLKVLLIYTAPLVLMSMAYYRIARVLWRADHVPGQAHTLKLQEHTQLRCRRQAAKMLVCVVVMFAGCYFPVHLLSFLRYTLVFEQSDLITACALVSHVLCYANSAVNPLIYNLMSGKFRREFRRSFCCDVAPTRASLSSAPRVPTRSAHCGRGAVSLRRDACTTTFIHNGSTYRSGYNGYNHCYLAT